MRYSKINPELFKNNRKNFSNRIKKNSIAIFHSSDEFPRNGDQTFPFRQNSDFFYLTGISQEKSILILAPDYPDPKLREVLFLIETNEVIAIWEGHKFTIQEAEDISGIANIKWLNSFDSVLQELMSWTENVYLNFNEYIKYSNEVPSRDLRFAEDMEKKNPAHNYLRSAPILHELRTIKSPIEIELIRKAIDITGNAFIRILKFIKPGVKEFEIQAEMEYEFIRNRANGMAYPPIIGSGKNSCVLHYIDNNDECKDNDLLLMDFGAEYANYAADITRTIPVNGKFTERQKECYEAVLRVHKKAIQLLVPGNTIEKVNAEVNKMMEKEMIGLNLFTKNEVKNQDVENPLFKKYFMHGTSHYLGLDVHDVGKKHKKFEEGMVLTCEPGIYIREENIGIRIENDILISNKGPVNLSENIPVEVDEIEKLIKNK